MVSSSKKASSHAVCAYIAITLCSQGCGLKLSLVGKLDIGSSPSSTNRQDSSPQISALQVSSSTALLSAYSSLPLTVSGGLAPYQYRVASGSGTINLAGVFTPAGPSSLAQSIFLGVSDALGSLLGVSATIPAAGTLDGSFGSGGIVIRDAVGSGSADQVNQTLILPDGKILGVGGGTDYGAGYYDFMLTRMNADGSLDTSYAANGYSFIDASQAGRVDEAYAATLQSDGTVMVTGRSDGASDSDVGVARVNADGSLNTGFATNGVFRWDSGLGNDYGNSVVIQPDGKILIGGSAANAGGGSDMLLIRLNTDGSPDSGFGTAGVVLTQPGTSASISAIALQTDGSIVAVGTSRIAGSDYAIAARYTATGALDSTFGSGAGYVALQPGGGCQYTTDVKVLTSGKILFSSFYPICAIQLNSDGSYDTSFASTGYQIVNHAGTQETKSVSLFPDGRVLITGRGGGPGGSWDFSLTRLMTDGTLDSSFNSGSTLYVDIRGGNFEDGVGKAALQPDGRIVVGGHSYPSSGLQDTAMIRVWP